MHYSLRKVMTTKVIAMQGDSEKKKSQENRSDVEIEAKFV